MRTTAKQARFCAVLVLKIMMSYNYGRRPPNIEGMSSLKVDNLSFRTTPEDLKPIFDKYGDVGDIYIPRDRWSKESRGFAFVRFYDRRDAEDALERLDGYVMDGRSIRVQMARYGRPADPPYMRDRDRDRRYSSSRRRLLNKRVTVYVRPNCLFIFVLQQLQITS